VLGLIGGVLMIILLYIDDKRNNNETSWTDYFKLLLSTSGIVTGMIFVYSFKNIGIPSLSKLTGWTGGGSQDLEERRVHWGTGNNRMQDDRRKQDDVMYDIPDF
jgi:hypothetical protein